MKYFHIIIWIAITWSALVTFTTQAHSGKGGIQLMDPSVVYHNGRAYIRYGILSNQSLKGIACGKNKNMTENGENHCDIPWEERFNATSNLSFPFFLIPMRGQRIPYPIPVHFEIPEVELFGCPDLLNDTLVIWKNTTHDVSCGCRLVKKDVFPQAKAVWTDGEGEQVDEHCTQESEEESGTHLTCKLYPDGPKKPLKCVGESQMTKENLPKGVQFGIKVIPKPKVIISVNDELKAQHNVAMTEGGKYGVKCRVQGSMSSVSRVTLECPGPKVEINNSTYLTLFAHKSMDGKECVCTTVSAFGNSSVISKMRITVRKVGDMQFVINDERKALNSTPGETVMIHCSVVGIVHYQMDVLHEDVVLEELYTSRKNVLSGGANMTCLCSGTYKCRARGENDTFISQSIDVNVECAPLVVDVPANMSLPIFEAANDSTVLVQTNIVGYPCPEEFELYQKANRVKRSPAELGHPVSKEEFNVTSIQTSPGHFRISIRLREPKHNDTGKFVLLMKNGVGMGGKFHFKVAKRSVSVAEPTKPPKQGLNAGVIAGIVVGCVALVIIGLALFIHWNMKKLDKEFDDPISDVTKSFDFEVSTTGTKNNNAFDPDVHEEQVLVP